MLHQPTFTSKSVRLPEGKCGFYRSFGSIAPVADCQALNAKEERNF